MVTIILPVYNSIKYIESCLNSIINQTFKDWKLFIFDDGSTDGTLEYLRKFEKEDDRVYLYERKNSYIQNLNEGINLADTKYIARMDSDDVMYLDRLEWQFNFMEENKQVDLVCNSVEVIDELGNHKGFFGSFFPNQLMDSSDLAFMNQIVHPSVFWRTKSLKDLGICYKEEFKYAEDWELWTQILENGLKIYNSSKPILKYRKVSTSMSRVHREEIDNLRNIIIGRLLKIRN